MSASPVVIHVIYYSMYGHVKALVDKAVEGIRATGAEAVVYRCAETLPEEVLEKMGAKDLKHNEGVPVVDLSTWTDCDGFLFACGTRYGGTTAQFRSFVDATGGAWQAGKAVGKTATIMTSTATQNGGQEATHLTLLPFLAHQGMVYVPLGYRCPSVQFDNSYSHGVSPYGASTLAGPKGERTPLEGELEAAKVQGETLANITKALKLGKAAMAEAK